MGEGDFYLFAVEQDAHGAAFSSYALNYSGSFERGDTDAVAGAYRLDELGAALGEGGALGGVLDLLEELGGGLGPGLGGVVHLAGHFGGVLADLGH